MKDDTYNTANTYFNMARLYGVVGHFPEALVYANAALQYFQNYGGLASGMIEKTQQLIAAIEQDRQDQVG
jgi:hypothetical protein